MVAHGITARQTRLVVLSPPGFDAWCAHEAFRRFVFGVFAERLADLMALVGGSGLPAPRPTPGHRTARPRPVVHASHQALADQLGTVREIVTRLLKQFERAGWVRLARERIDLLDAAALRRAGDRPALRDLTARNAPV